MAGDQYDRESIWNRIQRYSCACFSNSNTSFSEVKNTDGAINESRCLTDKVSDYGAEAFLLDSSRGYGFVINVLFDNEFKYKTTITSAEVLANIKAILYENRFFTIC